MQLLEGTPFVFSHSCTSFLLLYFSPVLGGALIKQLRVSFHQQLQNIEGEAVHSTVPMVFGVLVECTGNYGKEHFAVLVNQLHNVVIVPQEKSALGHLKVWACNAERNATEQRFLHLVKLWRLCYLKQLLE